MTFLVNKKKVLKAAPAKRKTNSATKKKGKKKNTTRKPAQKKLVKNVANKKPVKKKVPTKDNEPNLKELIRRGKVMFKKPGEDSDKLVMRTGDVEIALECSERAARRRMTKIRKALNLQKGDPIPVKQFCSMMKLEEADVQRKLKAY